MILFALAAMFNGCKRESSTGDIAPFAQQSSWSFAKQQRWTQMQNVMSQNAARLIELSQQNALRHAADENLTAAQLQQRFDSLEQRRTGDPQARSCRRVVSANAPYDYAGCSQQQLAAEFFQEREELLWSKQ